MKNSSKAGEKVINKNHPKYAEYITKCNKIADDGEKEIEEARKNNPDFGEGVEMKIRKRYLAEIKVIKQEYS